MNETPEIPLQKLQNQVAANQLQMKRSLFFVAHEASKFLLISMYMVLAICAVNFHGDFFDKFVTICVLSAFPASLLGLVIISSGMAIRSLDRTLASMA